MIELEIQELTETSTRKKYIYEIERYERFCDNQSRIDNVLSLIKIANYLEIKIDRIYSNKPDMTRKELVKSVIRKSHKEEIEEFRERAMREIRACKDMDSLRRTVDKIMEECEFYNEVKEEWCQ